MTREERARKALVEAIAFTNEGWVECPPERIVDLLVAFANAEAAAMRERAAECSIAYAHKAAIHRQLCTIDGGDETGEWYWAGRERGGHDLATAIRNLPATGEK